MIDPVFEETDAWWFWDETWTVKAGPYHTRDAAEDAWLFYMRAILGLASNDF